MITKNGFKSEYDHLPKEDKEKIRSDFEKNLGWGYFTFSKKKNGVYKLQPAEIIFVENYFNNFEK
jgi:hypothetical protein